MQHLTCLPKYTMILMKNFLKKMTKVLLALCRIKLYQNNVFSHENRKDKKKPIVQTFCFITLGMYLTREWESYPMSSDIPHFSIFGYYATVYYLT